MIRSAGRSFYFLCIILIAALSASYYLFFSSSQTVTSEFGIGYDTVTVTRILSSSANSLAKIHGHIKNEHVRTQLADIINKLQNLISSIDNNLETRQNLKTPTYQIAGKNYKRLVCPEIYHATNYDYPLFRNNFERTTNCSNVPKLQDVFSILLPFLSTDEPDSVRLLSQYATVYPNISIHIAGSRSDNHISKLPSNLSSDPAIHFHADLKDSGASSGRIWNGLVEKAGTPFVFIARGIHWFDIHSRIERLIEISTLFGIEFIGGAFRNHSNGHWNIGCQQSRLLNFTLAFEEGYFVSRNSCLYCDFLFSPFLASKTALQKYKFDDKITGHAVFEDLFLRLTQAKVQTLSCPDAMYHTDDTLMIRDNHDYWLPLIKKHELNEVILPSRRVLTYTCKEAGMGCPRGILGMAEPPCCLQQLADARKRFMQACEAKSILCELDSGDMPGAVKTNAVLPWDRDSDLVVKVDDYPKVLEIVESLKKQYGYWYVKSICKKHDKFGQICYCIDLHVAAGWYVQLWPVGEVKNEVLIRRGARPSRVNVDGYWAMASPNPGRWTRNRYHNEVYKHVSHWTAHGMKTSWVDYHPQGQFSKCPKPGHHACLDQYIADGNLNFRRPFEYF